MRKSKTQKGITLIALIITIVILLILAVVTINAIQGDGILQYASNAADEYTAKANEEQENLNTLLGQIEGNPNNNEEPEREVEVTHDTVIPVGAYYYRGDVNVTCSDCEEESALEFFWEGYCSNCGSNNLTLPDSTFKPGEAFPTPQTGDIYIYGDY